MEDEIKVSIICNTYNHESYIAEAIESFIIQKTNFKYEVLIYDDASTDKTAQIIREYELKYPNLIKPIYNKENQYSKGIKVSKFNVERAVGKYFAICEGDDYWTDPYKLQKQVDFLDEHMEYSLCVHAARKINAVSQEIISDIRPYYKSKDFSTEEIIYGGGGLFATNSMVYRRIGITDIPDFYYNAPVGDYPLTIYLSLIGRVYYMDENMSVYRFGVPNSWSMGLYSNIKKIETHLEKTIIMLNDINKYTNYLFNAIIERVKIKKQFDILILQGKIKEAKASKFVEYYSSLSKKSKFLIYMRKYLPNLYFFLKKIKKVQF